MNCTSVCKVTYTSHQGKGRVKQPIAKKETFLTFKVNKGFPTKIQTELNCVFYELFNHGMGLASRLREATSSFTLRKVFVVVDTKRSKENIIRYAFSFEA